MDAKQELEQRLKEYDSALSTLEAEIADRDTIVEPYMALIADLSKQIEDVKAAMKFDSDVQVANEAVEIAQQNHDSALTVAKMNAQAAFIQGDVTTKTWTQCGFTIGLREISTPVVTFPTLFLDHVNQIGATSILRSVVVKLNKKRAVDLYESLDRGLYGMKVEKKLSCSIKKASS